MEETGKNLETHQDTIDLEQISALLEEHPEPQPEHHPTPLEKRRARRDQKVILGLLITASALCLGIIAILSYWLTVLL